MSIRRPLAVSYMLMPTLSPEFMKRTLGLPTGLKVAVVASTGLGAPIGTPFLVMNAKFTYSRPVGRPELSGQRNWSYFMLHAAGSGTHRGLLAESGTRGPNGDESDYTGARCSVQCLPVLSGPSGTRFCELARLSPRH